MIHKKTAIDLAASLVNGAGGGKAVRYGAATGPGFFRDPSLRDVETVKVSSGVKNVPEEITLFPNLRRLDLRGASVESVPDIPGLILDSESYRRLKGRISAEHVLGLSFEGVHLTLPPQLEAFPNLRVLSFRADQGRLPEGIAALDTLEELDVDLPRVTVFPEEILRLRALKTLRLKAAVPVIPDSLALLSQLRHLLLHHNPVQKVPVAVRYLPELRYLNLNWCGIKVLPDWLAEVERLEALWMVGNELESFPDTLSELRHLAVLVASGNRIRMLPPSFRRLASSLRVLGLGENPLDMVPEPTFSLASLEALDLRAPSRRVLKSLNPAMLRMQTVMRSRGRIRVIPEQLFDLPNLRILEFGNQPIQTPPPEVVATGIEGMRAYYRQLREGTDYLCESKLLIVGEGGAGKTSLARKIEDPAYELKDDEKSTEGIGVIPWSFPTRIRVEGKPETVARDFHVSIWDFGGQEIYHATHQFFLTKRSLYVLVADSRKEDTDFQYWLNIVELLSDGSPLLIVKNEKQDRRRDINESRLRGRFGNLQRVLTTNLSTNRGLDEVVKVIREELERLPHIGSLLPKTWRRVREALEQDGRDHIPVEKYLEICRSNGFSREADMFQLSGYLHDLGVCLHFQDDPLLRKTVMLKPRWATDAVYRVLDSKRVMDRHGRFTREDLNVVWSEPRYAAMRDELVQLMMKFQLCYPLSQDEFLAPQLLESSPPSYPWDAQGNLVIRYEYEFMPKGILTRFIVATHQLIPREEWLWRDGVVLERGGTRAEVIEDYPQRRITVRLSGREKQELLAIVDYELDKIHRGYPRLKMSRLIPCPCSKCAQREPPQFFAYEELQKFARDGRAKQCPESYDMVDARRLLVAVFPKTSPDVLEERDGTVAEPVGTTDERREVFVSYAWGNESEKVVDRLEQTFRDRGIAVVRDKSDMQYRDSIQDFMRRIGRGKAIVVVLSKNYLESTSCMFELTQIAARGEMRKRVFPIVLEDAGIFEAVDRVEYVKVWEAKVRKLNAALKKVNQEDLKGVREELDLYAEIRRTITQLLEILRDMNALTPAQHLDSRFTALTEAIEEQIRS